MKKRIDSGCYQSANFIEIVRFIRCNACEYLIPGNLLEGKLVLCFIQKELEAHGREHKKNRPIVQKALFSTTLDQFTKAISEYIFQVLCIVIEKDYGAHLSGLIIGLKEMGVNFFCETEDGTTSFNLSERII